MTEATKKGIETGNVTVKALQESLDDVNAAIQKLTAPAVKTKVETA